MAKSFSDVRSGRISFLPGSSPMITTYDTSTRVASFNREDYDKMRKMCGYNPNLSPKGALELLMQSGFKFSTTRDDQKLCIGYDDAQNRPPSYLIGGLERGLFWEHIPTDFHGFEARMFQTPSGIVNVSVTSMKEGDKNLGYNFKLYNSNRDMPQRTSYETVSVPKIPIYKAKLVSSRMIRAPARA